MKHFKLISLLLFSLFFLTTCKKYPKNYLWFKYPEKVIARGVWKPWMLDYYSINDIDSTFANYLQSYKDFGVVIGEKSVGFGFYCKDIIKGGYWFHHKKKIISFGYAQENFKSNSNLFPSYVNQRNIFLNNGQDWKILKLCSTQFWITTEYNGLKYEIHFK